MTRYHISRRGFLTLVPAGAVAGVTAACSSSSTPEIKREVNADGLPVTSLFDPLQPPTNVGCSSTDSGIKLGWAAGSAPDGALRYAVTVDGNVVARPAIPSAAVTPLASGPHTISIETVTPTGTTSSATATIVLLGAQQDPPTDPNFSLDALAADAGVQLRWNDKSAQSGEVASYQVMAVGQTLPAMVFVRDSSGLPSAAFITNLSTDAPHEFYVVATGSTGASIRRTAWNIRVSPYRRAWPESYGTPSKPTYKSSKSGGLVSLTPTATSVPAVNVFARGKFVTQLAAGTQPSTLSAAPGQDQLSLISVSEWGKSSAAVQVSTRVDAASIAQSDKGFTTNGGRIISPDGTPYLPIGANISGMDFTWNDAVLGHASVARETWNWTAIRLSCGFRDWGSVNSRQGYTFLSNNNLDRIVDEYTGAGITTIIAQHHPGPKTSDSAAGSAISPRAGTAPDGTGRSSEDGIVDWWLAVASRFKNNPRVWFNLINEPGSDQAGLNSQYERMLTRIRAFAPRTPIVLDAANFANDIPNNATFGTGPITPEDSFVLTYGPGLVEKFGEPAGYGPIIFSIHVYSRWPRNYGGTGRITDAQLATRMRDYATRCRAKGLAILVGETGAETWAAEYDSASVRVGLYEQGAVAGRQTGVWPEQGVGVLVWHASPLSGMPLASTNWYNVTSAAQVSPQPQAGLGLWNYAHMSS